MKVTYYRVSKDRTYHRGNALAQSHNLPEIACFLRCASLDRRPPGQYKGDPFIGRRIMNRHRKTFSAKPADAQLQRKWHVVDATDKALGRLASEIALKLRGKDKPIFTPHVDTGDFVVVVNAAKVKVTGNKRDQKNYYRHSGYAGGLKVTNFDRMITDKPEFPIQHAVRGMLPKNRLGRALLKKLKVYAGPDHPHTAQQPEPLS